MELGGQPWLRRLDAYERADYGLLGRFSADEASFGFVPQIHNGRVALPDMISEPCDAGKPGQVRQALSFDVPCTYTAGRSLMA
jgi:hypothetical protein